MDGHVLSDSKKLRAFSCNLRLIIPCAHRDVICTHADTQQHSLPCKNVQRRLCQDLSPFYDGSAVG